MAGGARGSCLGALLQLAVVLTISMTLVQGQQISAAGCRNYQSSPKFNADYVAKMTSVEEGYAMLLTSDRLRTSGCQQINFYSNGTFFLSFMNDYEAMLNHTGKYTVQDASFTGPGYIDINVPPTALGTGLTGNIRLFFIVAEDDYFVVTTCEQFGIFALELVHAFTPISELGQNASRELNSTLAAMKVPQIERLREVNQACAANLRGTPNIFQIYNFLVKLGILPAIPFLSDSRTEQRTGSQFYNAIPTSVAYPGHQYLSPYGGPVQSIVYGPVQGLSQPIPGVGQPQANFYNSPSSSLGYPSLGFPYQNQGANSGPAVSYNFPSPQINSKTVGFGSQNSGVNYNSGAPYSIPTPGVGFDTSAVGSQQSGAQYISGAPFNFQSSGVNFDPSSFNSQTSGMNYDTSAFDVESRGVSTDALAISDQSPGITYDESAFNIKSSVISHDSPVLSAEAPQY